MKYCYASSPDPTDLTQPQYLCLCHFSHLECILPSSTPVILVYQNHLKDWSKHRLLGFTPEFPVWVPRIRISNKLPSDVNDSGPGSTLSEHLSRAQVSSETHLYLTLCVCVCVCEREMESPHVT